MSLFVIETEQFVDVDNGWKKIAKTTIEANNIVEALEKVDKQYRNNLFSHKVIIEKKGTVECKHLSYF